MTRPQITKQTGGTPASLPQGGIARFAGNLSQASSGNFVPQLQPIRFTPADAYSDLVSAIADVGDTAVNAAVLLRKVSLETEKKQRDAYLASVESDDIVQSNRIYNENMLEGNNPEALAEKLGAYKDGKKSSMPAEIQPFYEESFNKRAATLTVKSQDAFFKKAQDDSRDSLLASQKIIEQDIFANPLPKTEIEAQHYQEKLGKFQATLQSRVDNGFITAEEAALEQKGFQKDFIVASYKTQLQGLGTDARAKTIYALQQGKNIPAGLTASDKQDIVNQLSAFSTTLESTKEKAFARENAAIALTKARQIADMEIRANRGELGYEEVEKAEQTQLITPDKKSSFFKQLDGERDKQIKESESLQKVGRALQGLDYLDPKNTDDKKAVDLTYSKAVEPRLADIQDPAAQKTLVANFVDAVGFVPATLQSRIRGVFRSGNVQDKIYYADLVGRIQETKPQALDDFDDKDITQAIMIDQMVKAGTPNEEAVKKVEDITQNTTPGRIDMLKTQYQELRRKEAPDVASRNGKTLSRIRDLYDGGFFSRDAAIPNQQLGVEVAAVSDYDKLYETWYLNTNGDSELAKKQADRIFKGTWGTTNVNGTEKQLTKYPIEQAYPRLSSEEIKGALVSDLKTLPKYKKIKPDEVFLQYDSRTAREYGAQPTYRVLVLNSEGVLEPVAEPTKTRWKPDYNGMLQEKQRKAEEEAKILREKGPGGLENFKSEQRDAASRANIKRAAKEFASFVGGKD